MTHSEIEARVALWQQRLGLAAWQINFVWDVEPEGDFDGEALAEVDAQSVPYLRSNMSFSKKVTDWPADAWGEHGGYTADQVIVHELLHLAQRDCDRAAMDLDDGQLPRDVAEVRNSAYHEARERFVDSLAIALVAAFDEEKAQDEPFDREAWQRGEGG